MHPQNQPVAPKRRATPAQIAASRANGAKSRGPKTPEGKARSSRNALKHGFTSNSFLLDPAQSPAYHALLAAFRNDWAPSTPIELSLVENLAFTQWAIRRIWEFEPAAADEFTRNASRPAPRTRSGESALPSIARIENRLHLDFHRTLRRLHEIRRLRHALAKVQPPETRICKNEPGATTNCLSTEFAETNPATSPQPVIE